MKNKGCKIAIRVFLFAFFVVGIGIPIIINELYKREGWYSTVWTGADALAYWGTLLGAGATIFALIVTIITTHKQVQSERMYQLELEKWHNLEKSVDNMLVVMNPLRCLRKLDAIQPSQSDIQLDQLIEDLTIREDVIMINLSSDDYKRIAPFLEIMKKTKEEEISAIHSSRKYFDICNQIGDLEGFDDKKKEEYYAAVYTFDTLHEKRYTEMIKKKRCVFDEIYREIAEQSHQPHSFGRFK